MSVNRKCDIIPSENIIPKKYANRIEELKSKYYHTKIKDDYKYRAISLPMMTILNIINYGENAAIEKHLHFPGLTSKQIEQIMGKIWSNVENVHNYLYRLTRLAFLKRVQYGTKSGTKFYYQINTDRFPCHRGEFMFCYIDKYTKKSNLYIGACPVYQFCDCKPKSCIYLEKLKEQLSLFSDLKIDVLNETDFFLYYNNKLTDWILDNEKIGSYSSDLQNIFNNYKIPITHIKELYDHEIIMYWREVQEIEKSGETIKTRIAQLNEVAQQINTILRQDKTKDSVPIPKISSPYRLNMDIGLMHDLDIQKDPTSGRGLTPSMSYVLQIINLGWQYFKTKNQNPSDKYYDTEFPGLSSYHIEYILEGLPVSKDIVSDCLYRLARLTYLCRNTFPQEKRNIDNHYFYQNFNRFPCHLGTYIIQYPSISTDQNICIANCPHHLKCGLKPTDCKLIDVLKTQINWMIAPYTLCLTDEDTANAAKTNNRPINWKSTAFYTHLQSMAQQWTTDYCNLEKYTNILFKFFPNDDRLDDLIDAEIIFYGKELEKATEDDTTYFIKEIIELIDFKRVKQSKQYNKQTKKDIERRKDFNSRLLDLIINTKPTQNLNIDF